MKLCGQIGNTVEDESPPARAVWIETRALAALIVCPTVTAREGGVD